MGASGIALPYPNWENPTAPVRPPFLFPYTFPINFFLYKSTLLLIFSRHS